MDGLIGMVLVFSLGYLLAEASMNGFDEIKPIFILVAIATLVVLSIPDSKNSTEE